MMIASVLIELLAAGAMATSSPVQDCRAITDQSSRLACYDAREAAQAPVSSTQSAPPTMIAPAPATAPPAPAPVAARQAMPAPAPPVSSAAMVRADPTGTIVSVVPLRHGLFRLVLDDGRAFETATNVAAPPAVGAAVVLRRTLIGTTFLDVPGRSPLAVRLARR